jgi:hypothetical protein
MNNFNHPENKDGGLMSIMHIVFADFRKRFVILVWPLTYWDAHVGSRQRNASMSQFSRLTSSLGRGSMPPALVFIKLMCNTGLQYQWDESLRPPCPRRHLHTVIGRAAAMVALRTTVPAAPVPKTSTPRPDKYSISVISCELPSA